MDACGYVRKYGDGWMDGLGLWKSAYIHICVYIWNFYSKNNFKILTCWLR